LRLSVKLLLSAMFFSSVAARADIVYLTDGTKVEGKIHKTDDGWSVTKADGTVVDIDADKVDSIEATPTDAGISVGEDRLLSLRRAVQNMTDPHDIIDRYQKFIATTGNPTVLAEARQDLQMWQGRLDQGMVKLGDQWIPSGERDRRRALAQSEALPAKDLINNYKYAAAAQILQQAVLDDPQCATALYLQGVMFYKQDQVTEARKSFEAVVPIVPDHGPTLNNLAVIAWREKSFVVAMNYYDQAMMASPVQREILDNVAEAINVVPHENQNAPVVLKGVRLFAEQDTTLQKIAAQQGMYRWGATWVNATQLAELKAAEAKVKQQMDALQQQVDALQQQIDGLNADAAKNQIQMDRLQAQSIIVDRNGNQIQLPLPDDYYQLKNDNASLTSQKQTLVDQQNKLHDRAKDIEAQIPVPKFTGVQQIIGVDGVPVRDVGSGPATVPSPERSSQGDFPQAN
jgi:tetratricopeptide (TPR) repeat protein